MKINNLCSNNIYKLNQTVTIKESIGIGGLSGSGKTTYCSTLSHESKKRIVSLLLKSDYQFLFPEIMKTNASTQAIEDLPLIFFLRKKTISSNPRSTIGTHTGIFKDIRKSIATKHSISAELLSFNNPMCWCHKCKGRGVFRKIICPRCNGSRYSNIVDKYKIFIRNKNFSIRKINQLSIDEIIKSKEALEIQESNIHVLKNAIAMNMGYLSLDRVMNTLSGGELTRLYLSEFMAYSENIVIIIDEISVGLDRKTLYRVLNEIEKISNNNVIWLIDHSDIVLASTEKNIFFGPKSGKHGGKIVESSPIPFHKNLPINLQTDIEYFEINDLKYRNIDISKLILPKNRLISVTGESGCGKSTLINECLAPLFPKYYPTERVVLVGQDRSQSVTSKSTIATFLGIKNISSIIVNDILHLSIEDILNTKLQINIDKAIYGKLSFLFEIGLGYLTIERQIQTLSTGEFQCVHLIAEFFNIIHKDVLFILDEPSKGLSQNILNHFVSSIREMLQKSNITILMIEHNEYMLSNSDFIIDFGERTLNTVTNLEVVSNKLWFSNHSKSKKKISNKIISNIKNIRGIEFVSVNGDCYFSDSERNFYGGILKNLSQTANWIYGDYESNITKPLITIDLEKQLYSPRTFLYEIAGIINHIVNLSNSTNISKFDFFNRANHCKCCKGKGEIKSFNSDLFIEDKYKGIWDGMMYKSIMKELKRYNYTKIKFLFTEIKKTKGYDLSKSYNSMSNIEQEIFLYGYWDCNFYDKKKQTTRSWRGVLFLIEKYLKGTKSTIKNDIKNSTSLITCPVCNGTILSHSKKLLINGNDIRNIIGTPIKYNIMALSEIKPLKNIINLLGDEFCLNQDVTKFDQKIQVELKLIEILYNSFYNYEIIFNNYYPYQEIAEPYLKKIKIKNKVVICDSVNLTITKDELLQELFSKYKIKRSTLIYELIEFKEVKKDINKIRKKFPCNYCKGKKKLRVKDIDDRIDTLTTPCHYCYETGISKDGLKKDIEGYSVENFELGTINNFLSCEESKKIQGIKVSQKIEALNKKDIYEFKKYLESKC